MTASREARLPDWLQVVIVGLAFRGVWIAFVHPEPIADYAFYYTRAIGLAQGSGYAYQGHPTAFFPVGTSLVLAAVFTAFGHSLTAAHLVSLVAWAGTSVLTLRLAQLVADRRTAWWAGVLVAVHPDLVASSALVASENLFIPLLLGTLLVSCVARRSGHRTTVLFVVAGLLYGAALLVRSTALLLFPLLIAFAAFDRRRGLRCGALHAGAFVVATSLVLGPWVVRNLLVMGKPVLSTNGGISLWWGNNAHASGGFPLSAPLPVQDLTSIDREIANNARFMAEAMAFITADPTRWLALAPSKLRYLITSDAQNIGFALRYRYVGGVDAIEFHPRLGNPAGAELANYVERPLTGTENRLIGLYYHLAGGWHGVVVQRALWVTGLIGWAWIWRRERDRRACTLLVGFLVPVGWVLFHVTLGNGQARYMTSVMPIAIIGVAFVCCSLRRLVNDRHLAERSAS